MYAKIYDKELPIIVSMQATNSTYCYRTRHCLGHSGNFSSLLTCPLGMMVRLNFSFRFAAEKDAGRVQVCKFAHVPFFFYALVILDSESWIACFADHEIK